MNNSPKLWDKLLAQSPKGSVLMGGAIIDYLLNIPVNDYDIFYTYQPGQGGIFPDNWVLTDADFNDPKWIQEHDAWYLQGTDELGNHPISSVQEYLVDGEHKVQLIGVTYVDPLKHMKNFDHSLTLTSYNAKGMFVHKQTLKSLEDHTVKYMSKDLSKNSVDRSRIRAAKKIARLPVDGQLWEFEGFSHNPVGDLQWFNNLAVGA